MVVCSASTFCLWPALSNTLGMQRELMDDVIFMSKCTCLGQVHFPLTPLVARAATNETAPKLAPNFHWIKEVQMIKEFKKYRPWSNLIDDLESL